MTTTTFFCRICRGPRPFSATRCLGCGTPRATALISAEQLAKHQERANRVPECPKCHKPNAELFQAERFKCRACGTVFERVEFACIDTRPEQCAMKNERRHKL